MSVDDLSARLVELGLSPDEARTYVHLNRMGPSPAASLATTLRTSRPRSYRLLETLAGHGFVTSSVGRPRLFQAVPPGVVLETLHLRTRDLLDRIGAARGELVPRLEGLRSGGSGIAEPHFTVLRGLTSLGGQASDLCAAAASSLDILLAASAGPRAVRALLHPRAVQERLHRGCAVRVLLVHPEPAAPATPLPDLPGVEARVARTDMLCTYLLADRREGLTLVAADMPRRAGTGRALGFRTNAQHFVSMQQLLFDHLWQGAQPVARAGRPRKGAGAGNA